MRKLVDPKPEPDYLPLAYRASGAGSLPPLVEPSG